MKVITAALLFLLTIHGLAAPKPVSFEFVEIPGANTTKPRGINNVGDISGFYWNADGRVLGFIKRGEQITTLSVPGSLSTLAYGIDDQGRVAGHYVDSPFGPFKGFIYQNGQFTTVIHPNAVSWGTELRGISEGQAVGIFDTHGFLYSNGQFIQLDVPGAAQTIPNGIHQGRVVGSWSNGQNSTHGFLYENGQYTTIDFPRPNDASVLSAISDDTILGATGAECVFDPFILIRGKFYLLDLPGIEAHGINDSGTIVGDYGRERGFVAQASKFILRGN